MMMPKTERLSSVSMVGVCVVWYFISGAAGFEKYYHIREGCS